MAVIEATRTVRLGVVRFVNTLPLIDGLEKLADVTLSESVPSRLIDRLLAGQVDVALCSSIDYQRATEPLVVVPCGCLASAGSTLTVRLYATAPFERLQRIHCDTDSHTSVVLLRILLAERFGIEPELVDLDPHRAGEVWPEAVMLIGDKVVTAAPPAHRYPHQLDLGAAWYELTGLPFVFGAWMALAAADPEAVAVASTVLDRQRRHNHQRIAGIVHRRAAPRNWPRELATDYLQRKLRFELTPQCVQGLELFWSKAQEQGVIEKRRELVVAPSWGAEACRAWQS